MDILELVLEKKGIHYVSLLSFLHSIFTALTDFQEGLGFGPER